MKIFLWCECSFTKLGFSSLLDEKFDISYSECYQDFNMGNKHDLYIFIVSNFNIFAISMLVKSNPLLMKGKNILFLSKNKLVDPLRLLCTPEVKNISISQFTSNIEGSINDILSCNSSVGNSINNKVTIEELKIMKLISEGKSITDISIMLKKSIKTVSGQKVSFFKKIGLKNNLALFHRHLYRI